jgi:tetratricopeptide (TPR) repeat protein
MGKKNRAKTKQNFISKTKPPGKQSPARKKNVLPWILVAAGVSAICLSPILKDTFTNWDDEFYVVNNALLRGPDWPGIFTQPVVSNYHPITVLTLALNYAMSGLQAWSYLLFNLLLHVANTVLVFLFIYRISGQRTTVAFLTALLFAIHPMHVESVAWISERKDVLYTLFFMLSLMQYWRFLNSSKAVAYWLCLLFFVLSLLSKPAAIILPLVLFLLDYWKGRQVSKKIFIEKIPFFVISALFAVITLQLQSATAMTSLYVYPIWVRLLFACYVIMTYGVRFFIPYPLSAFHPFPAPNDLGWQVYLSPIFVAALLFVIWHFRKNKSILFGLLFFLVNVLLVLQLVSIGFTIVSERYTYVPYIGLAFTLAMIVQKFFARKNTLPWLLTTVVFGVFALISFNRTMVWKDSDTLWRDVIKTYPAEPLPRAEHAEYLYNKAITMPPAEATPLFQQIIADCTAGIRNSSDSLRPDEKKGGISLYYMRAIAFNSLNQVDRAFADFNHCLFINPAYTEALYYRGTLLVNHYNKNTEALKDFTKAIQLNAQGKYYLNRSICYYKLGDLVHAKADGQMAMQKGVVLPDNYRHILNL